MSNVVAIQEVQFSAPEVRDRVNLVQTVMKSVMKKDTHYGTIPFTPKPTLYKAGAEVLCMTFKIAQEYRVEDLSTSSEARYRVTCVGRHQVTGQVLGEGMGECSSNEEKYAYRSAVCPQEFDAAPEANKRVKWSKGKNNSPAYSTNQVKTNVADLANTILKMACKRAMVAMTLNVTAASDIFSQDLEDFPDELREFVKTDTQTSTTAATAVQNAQAAAAAGVSDQEKELAIMGLEIEAARGNAAFRVKWVSLSDAVKAAVGIAERNRIDAISKEADKKESDKAITGEVIEHA